MYPSINLSDSLISLNNSLDTLVFSSFKYFRVLPEEHLFSLILCLIWYSFCKHSYHCLHSQFDLRSALKISCLIVFGPSSSCFLLSNTDLGSKEPLTLPIVVNNSLSTSLLIDTSASSQFFDIDSVGHMNLKMILKPESQDLILTDGNPSPCHELSQILSRSVVLLTAALGRSYYPEVLTTALGGSWPYLLLS